MNALNTCAAGGVGFALLASLPSVRPYLAQHPIPYTISVADLPFAGRYGVTGALPDTVLIDRRGRIADFHEGKVDKDAWKREIRDLLAEK